jgi:hypothetical protein
MREIRTSGSEGGGAGNLTGPPYPYIPDAPTGLTFETPPQNSPFFSSTESERSTFCQSLSMT